MAWWSDLPPFIFIFFSLKKIPFFPLLIYKHFPHQITEKRRKTESRQLLCRDLYIYSWLLVSSWAPFWGQVITNVPVHQEKGGGREWARACVRAWVRFSRKFPEMEVVDGPTEAACSRFKRVCVFCGSSTGKRNSYADAALELAQELVQMLSLPPSPPRPRPPPLCFASSVFFSVLSCVFSLMVDGFLGRCRGGWTWFTEAEASVSWVWSLGKFIVAVETFLGTFLFPSFLCAFRFSCPAKSCDGGTVLPKKKRLGLFARGNRRHPKHIWW